MVVPIFRKGLIVAILGVGNKISPYEEADLEAATLLADLAWDSAEIKRTSEALRESEERWKFALEGSGECVWDWNVQKGELSFSRHGKEMLGYAEDKIVNHFDEWKKLVHPDDLARVLATIQAYFRNEMPEYSVEHRFLCKDGSWKWILSRGMIVKRLSDGRPLRMVGTHADITERKDAEVQNRFMAYHDRLTGLPNRSMFFDRFSRAISQARRNSKRVGLLFVDLDGFKPVNDDYGHEAGDIVLKIIAERLMTSVRAMDTVARIGGDEFVVILGELDSSAEVEPEVEPVARKLIAAITQQIVLPQSKKCSIGASIGISIYPDHGTEMDTLLVAADTAMYQSKHGGKGCYTFFVNDAAASVEGGNGWARFDEEHIVGIPEIDEQHRHLVDLINTLNKTINDNEDEAVLKKHLEELTEYTTFHFKTEHDFMERYNYPQRQSHDFAHGLLLADASHFKTRFYRGGDLFVLQSIKDWLLHHIITEDKPLGEFLKEKLSEDGLDQ
jgi:diguanylate cyclase (GGDEF)-like protein/hemerythrin-like metal-binding protein/PAS domain S-box-containing protein